MAQYTDITATYFKPTAGSPPFGYFNLIEVVVAVSDDSGDDEVYIPGSVDTGKVWIGPGATEADLNQVSVDFTKFHGAEDGLIRCYLMNPKYAPSVPLFARGEVTLMDGTVLASTTSEVTVEEVEPDLEGNEDL